MKYKDFLVLKTLFEKIDKDGNGVLSVEEIFDSIKSKDDKLSDDVKNEIIDNIKKADSDNSGTLNLNEFITYMEGKVEK